MMPLPFPDLEIVTRGNTITAKLTNEQLANMLKQAIEQQGRKVKDVQVFPDVFVVIIDISDVIPQYLPAKIEPNEIKIIIDRKKLIEKFVEVGQLQQKGIRVTDKVDYIEIVGTIPANVRP